MNAPRLRTVAVSAGFLGLTIVVAGAATAMTAQSSDEPVATAVTLEIAGAGASGDEELDSADPAPPATPVEVRPNPIECTPDGICGTTEPETSTVAIEVTAAQTGREDSGASAADEQRDDRRAERARPEARDAHRHEDERGMRHDRDRAEHDGHGDGWGGRHDGRGEGSPWRDRDQRDSDGHSWGDRERHDRKRG